MADPLTISDGEHGLVRVFALVRPADLRRGHELPLAQIADWLGVASLNGEDVQQLWTDDLADMSLPEFLSDGYGVSQADLSDNSAALEGVMDMHPTILVFVRSPAFRDRPAAIGQDGPLFLVAALREPDANVVFEALPNPGSGGVLQDPPQKAKPSDAAMSGRIATLALLVLFALVGLMIWIGG